MKRHYADLHLRINPNDQQTTERSINKAADLGYRYISIPFVSNFQEDQATIIKHLCKQRGLDFVLRVDFKPRTQQELMRFLRKYRRRVEIICIECDSKEIARQAAKDRRVDLLSFPSLDYRKRFFDRAEAELARNSLVALEIDIKQILVLEGPPRVRLLTSLHREAAIAREFHVPIVVSSGVDEELLMHMPRDMASLSYLFGLNESEALNAVSTNPSFIVERNRQKLTPKFVAPGITLIKEGSDQ